jgi:uracil phosphoribosyltransferase
VNLIHVLTNSKAVCGVSILRSGGPLERGMQRVIRDVAIGSLLIQSDAKTGEPLLLHVLLPIRIRHRHLAKDTWVFLLDAQVRLHHLLECLSSRMTDFYKCSCFHGYQNSS